MSDSAVPSLSWDNPDDRQLLEYIREQRGEEIAGLVTLPENEYFQEIGRLLAVNDLDQGTRQLGVPDIH